MTVADLRAQRFIQGSLAAAYSELTVIGEEADEQVAEQREVVLYDPVLGPPPPAVDLPHEHTLRLADLVLWLDPLDGTYSDDEFSDQF